MGQELRVVTTEEKWPGDTGLVKFLASLSPLRLVNFYPPLRT